MLPGDECAQVINDRLNSADIILLLVSANSISDHTCYDIEIKPGNGTPSGRRSPRHPDFAASSRLDRCAL
jgi:hypothetical protein